MFSYTKGGYNICRWLETCWVSPKVKEEIIQCKNGAFYSQIVAEPVLYLF